MLQNASMVMPDQKDKQKAFIPNEIIQFGKKAFPAADGIDLYIDGARFLPDNCTASKIQISAYSLDKKKISVSAGGLPNLDDSTTFMHQYNFRYEFRLPKFDPTTVVFITIYSIDRTSNRVVTVGYAMINLFLNAYSMQPCTNPKDRDTVLMEGNYQMPIYIMDPRMMQTLRLDRV